MEKVQFTIHKQALTLVDDPQRLQLPKDAVILSVQEQHRSIIIWYRFRVKDTAEVSNQLIPVEDTVTRRFQIFPTGTRELFGFEGVDHIYLATVQSSGYVWHIFELLNDK
ncbi:MAG: hypothetical protein H6550_16115 [Chitinophagales bacterium]|nr:hypothetical protein [Chitinophagales bacterium]